jgi:hypothetical protein
MIIKPIFVVVVAVAAVVQLVNAGAEEAEAELLAFGTVMQDNTPSYVPYAAGNDDKFNKVSLLWAKEFRDEALLNDMKDLCDSKLDELEEPAKSAGVFYKELLENL